VEPKIRPVTAEEWPAATELAARAFLDEPYTVVAFGDDRLDRFATLNDHYRAAKPDANGRLMLGAFAGSHVVGIAGAYPPASCPYCRRATAEDLASDDPFDIAFRDVDVLTRRSHAELEPHWYVAPVATEPVLQGSGIGRLLMDRLAEAAMARELAAIVLECGSHLVPFYERCGYERGADVSHGRIDLHTMVRRLPGS
jgi:GNAT superfamily N-acetyltransferase